MVKRKDKTNESRQSLTRKSGHGTRGDRLRRLLDFDEAHAAVTGDGEAAVVAEARDIDAGDLAGLQDSKALGNLDWIAINEDFDSVFRVWEMDPGPAHGAPRRKIWSGLGLGLGRRR